MPRPDPRVLSPSEQAETDRTAEAVLAMLKRVLRPGQPFDRVTHDAWLEELDVVPRRLARGRPAHSEGCDCAACLAAAILPSGPEGPP